MKPLQLGKVFLLLAFIALCSAQLISAQSPNNGSSIKIEIKNYRYIVTGAVSSEVVKSEIVGKVNETSRNNADFSGLKIDANVKAFAADWQKSFDKALFKSKLWKSGVFIFTANQTSNEYPNLPDEILNAEIFLIDDKKPIKISDYRNKTVVLFFLAHWCRPCIQQALTLKEFYPQISSNGVEIIGVNADAGDDEEFKKFVSQSKFNYKTALANENLFKAALNISKFQGIPQAFLIRDGKLYGIFFGNAPNTVKKLKETTLEVSKTR
jgi:peroxiredoxin